MAEAKPSQPSRIEYQIWPDWLSVAKRMPSFELVLRKSQMLKYVSKLAPKGRYVSGKGTTGAGLTATVVRDEFLRGWSLEAGALVLQAEWPHRRREGATRDAGDVTRFGRIRQAAADMDDAGRMGRKTRWPDAVGDVFAE